MCSGVSDSAAPWTVAGQASLPMELSGQDYRSGAPSQPRGQTVSLVSPALAGGFLTTGGTWEAPEIIQISLWNYVRNQCQKIFENNPHIFKCNVTFTKRDL